MSPIPDPPGLDPTTLSIVLSEIGDMERARGGRPFTEQEITEQLMDSGYGHQQTESILDVYLPKCSACGERATHQYGQLSEDGSVSSMAGPGKLTPSCDRCADPSVMVGHEFGNIRAPLAFNYTGPDPEDPVDRLVLAITGGGQDDLREAIKKATETDAGEVRTAMGAMALQYCRSVAACTRHEIYQTSFSECLLDLLADVTGMSR